MKYFIEAFTPKQAWLDLTKEARAAYMAKVNEATKPITDQGAEVVTMGENDSDTTYGLSHNFFVVWKFPTDELEKSFEDQGIIEGWYDYFDQFNIRGNFSDIIEKLVNL